MAFAVLAAFPADETHMTAFREANVEAILSACGGNAAALAESLSQCFDRKYRVEVGESDVWSPKAMSGRYGGPGILALFQVETQGLAVLVPEGLPLPEWYTHPTDTEKARLETLSMEWSMNLLPAELEAEKFRSLVVPNLVEAIGKMAPAEWAVTLELLVFDAGRTSDKPAAKSLVVWPLEQPKFDIEVPRAAPASPAAAKPQAALAAPGPMRADPLARLRHLPVQISVRLAEKKIPMSQLLGITPGMLITFNKSCEELLDLYINNSRYCRGEAVKIGENFGLKINQVGVPEETRHKVIDA